MITLTDKLKCTGCSACAEVCTSGAIAMKSDGEGFPFPYIDESRCVSCKQCVNVCPADKEISVKAPMSVFAARAKDDALLRVSSSGGIFGILARETLSGGGVVFGAGFDGNFNVVHRYVEKPEDVSAITGSKYVQSQIGSAYKDAKAFLKEGRKVLFAGTPCQCAGLKAYLNENYNNLLTVDFVCHGVPSPQLYKKYLQHISAGKKVAKVNFRCKTEGISGYVMGIDFENGELYRAPVAKDPYLLAYSQNISLRNSCYRCVSKGFRSVSDLTLGDFWGIEDTDSSLKDKHGVSLVLVNTNEGEAAFEAVRENVERDTRNISEALLKNPSVTTSVKKNPLREKYLRDAKKLDIDKLTDKYCGSSYTAKLRRLIAKVRKDR